MAAGAQMGSSRLCSISQIDEILIRKRVGHRNGQIEQNCAINCGIQGNKCKKDITKHKNLFYFKSIFETIQWFPRYRIVALILIGRFCNVKIVLTINHSLLPT